MNDEQWERIGMAWREAAGQNNRARLDAPAFIRWLKQAGYIEDYVRVPDRTLPTSEGKYDPDTKYIYYPESTWIAAKQGDPHAIWSLVHEGSHAICRHQEVRFRSQPSARNRFSSRTSRDEAEAHRLTASLLAPFDKADFTRGMTVESIRKRFGLSQEAAERRLKEFERIFRTRRGLRRPLPPGVIDFLTEQKRKGFRVTSLDGLENLCPQPTPNYEGDPCPVCGKFKMIRIGTHMKCNASDCGAVTGDG